MTFSKTAAVLATATLAATAVAHPGHSHEMTAGGEMHHLLWLAPVALLAIFAVKRALKSRG